MSEMLIILGLIFVALSALSGTGFILGGLGVFLIGFGVVCAANE